jgi:hypothetical protein
MSHPAAVFKSSLFLKEVENSTVYAMKGDQMEKFGK